MNAVLSGTLLFLAFLPLPTGLLVWVALIPWLLVFTGPDRQGLDWLGAARSGALLFGVFWGLHLSWVLLLVPRIQRFWPVSAYLGQVLLLALLGGLAGAGLHQLRSRLPLPVAAATVWVAVEWLRGQMLGPLRFPWSPLALPLVEWTPLLQPAAWTGEQGLGFLVILVNGLLACAVFAWRGGRAERGWYLPGAGPGLAAILLLVAWWTVGSVRMTTTETRPVVRAGAVQPAVPLAVKRDSGAAFGAALERIEGLLPELEETGVDVVVLPETVFPAALPDTGTAGGARSAFGDLQARRSGQALEAWLAERSARLGVPLLLGAYATADGRENAVVQVGPSGQEARYGKVGLVPGVEWIPGRGLARGGNPAPLPGAGGAGPLVCIESAWASVSRRHARLGAAWLVNVTNDAWLGDGAEWTRTPAFRQHPRHLALRSVETGLGALRVANGGLTGVVSPFGEWNPLLPPYRPGVAVAEVERLDGPTPYVRLGGLLGPVCLLALALGWLPVRATATPPAGRDA